MRKLLFVFLFLGLVSCGKKNNNDTVVIDEDNGPLSEFEVQSLVKNTWCDDNATVQFTYAQNGGGTCTSEITLRHNITQFSDKEYFVEFSYSGNQVRCRKSFGNPIFLNANQVNNQLRKRGYRLSFTGKNQALMTNIGKDEVSQKVEVYVDSNSANIVPVNKNLRPTDLYNCQP